MGVHETQLFRTMTRNNTTHDGAEPADGGGPVKQMSKYAPVRFGPGADASTHSDSVIVGRRPMAALDGPISEATVELTNQSCPHYLIAGSPRCGKDTVLVSLAEALMDEFGYKYVSVHDDGRMETPLLALPSDDPAVLESLDKFDVAPKGMDAEVFIPDIGQFPTTLPSNFTRFTFDKTVLPEEHVEELADAGGLLRRAGHEDNLDMETIIEDNDRAAVLCCQFLSGNRPELKFTIIDAWLRLIYQAREDNPRLPRVAVEARDVDQLAPARLSDTRFSEQKERLREIVYKIATQGPSRRVMLLGSASRPLSLWKPVRENMANRVVMKMPKATVDSLVPGADGHTKSAVNQFEKGVGLVFQNGAVAYPVEFRPARCSVDVADAHWRDCYGEAWGARVRYSATEQIDADWWVDIADADTHTGDLPDVGEWYLQQEDFPGSVAPDDVDADLVEMVLEERRRDGVSVDCSLTPSEEL